MLNLAGEYAPKVRVNCVAPGAILSADWEHEHFKKIVNQSLSNGLVLQATLQVQCTFLPLPVSHGSGTLC